MGRCALHSHSVNTMKLLIASFNSLSVPTKTSDDPLGLHIGDGKRGSIHHGGERRLILATVDTCSQDKTCLHTWSARSNIHL